MRTDRKKLVASPARSRSRCGLRRLEDWAHSVIEPVINCYQNRGASLGRRERGGLPSEVWSRHRLPPISPASAFADKLHYVS